MQFAVFNGVWSIIVDKPEPSAPIKPLSYDSFKKNHYKDKNKPEKMWARALLPWQIVDHVDFTNMESGQTVAIGEREFTARLISRELDFSRENSNRVVYLIEIAGAAVGWEGRLINQEYKLITFWDGELLSFYANDKDEDGTDKLEKLFQQFLRGNFANLDILKQKDRDIHTYLSCLLAVTMISGSLLEVGTFNSESQGKFGDAPLFCSPQLIIGFCFFQDQAHEWCREQSGCAAKVGQDSGQEILCLYVAPTLHQFKRGLPSGSRAISIADFNMQYCEGRFDRQIERINHLLDEPRQCSDETWDAIKTGQLFNTVRITTSEIHEALEALKLPTRSVDDFRYQLAAGVLLNAWLDQATPNQKKLKAFYAFKETLGRIINENVHLDETRVDIWRGESSGADNDVVYARVDGTEFSFHAIPRHFSSIPVLHHQEWSGVRLKPFAPLVLAYCRRLRIAKY